jgi:hypothetical protein
MIKAKTDTCPSGSSALLARRRGPVGTYGVVENLLPRKWQGQSCRLVPIRGSVSSTLLPAQILLSVEVK